MCWTLWPVRFVAGPPHRQQLHQCHNKTIRLHRCVGTIGSESKIGRKHRHSRHRHHLITVGTRFVGMRTIVVVLVVVVATVVMMMMMMIMLVTMAMATRTVQLSIGSVARSCEWNAIHHLACRPIGTTFCGSINTRCLYPWRCCRSQRKMAVDHNRPVVSCVRRKPLGGPGRQGHHRHRRHPYRLLLYQLGETSVGRSGKMPFAICSFNSFPTPDNPLPWNKTWNGRDQQSQSPRQAPVVVPTTNATVATFSDFMCCFDTIRSRWPITTLVQSQW